MRAKLAVSLLLASVFGAGFALAQTPPQAPEFPVNTYTTGDQSLPGVAMAPNGDFVIAWRSEGQVGTGAAIFARRFDVFGSPLSGEFQVNTYTAGTFGYTGPSVAMDPTGNFVVVWESFTDGSSSGIAAQRFDSAGVAQGGEFQVNSYTTNNQYNPVVSVDSSGKFVVVWQSRNEDASGSAVIGRRFDASGAPLGANFQVNTTTAGYQYLPHVATDSAGGFVVVWDSQLANNGYGVFGRRYDGSGNPLSAEFQVNTYTTSYQYQPKVAVDGSGSFTVVWSNGGGLDGSLEGMFSRRFDSSGGPLGNEFQVNSYTTGYQFHPGLAMDPAGNFVVTWTSDGQDGSGYGVFGQRFDPSGRRIGSEFMINTYTTNAQRESAVAIDPSGNFVVAWESSLQDGAGYGIFAKRLEFRAAGPMVVDGHSATGTSSNVNGVLEPGETVQVEPSYLNTLPIPVTFTATAANLTGPPGPTYTIDDNTADYGTTAPGNTTDCYNATPLHDCYQMTVSGTRPTQHWDATFDEMTSPGSGAKTWTLHVGESFPDVPTSQQFYKFIENLFHNGITGGCGGGNYCPDNSVTRGQMAVFLLKAAHGPSFVPPGCTGVFPDVACPSQFADWIEELFAEGITGGCGGGNYCPTNPVTRAQMAVFLLKAEHGSSYVPPACTGVFPDVPCPSQFADWIEQLFAEAITGGCGGGNYCPTNPNTRGQMAVFLVKTFGLLLYGP